MILDFNKPHLSKTEKAIAVLQTELQNLAMTLQRQIVAMCIDQKISPQRFTGNNHKLTEINNFLMEAQKADEIIVNAEKREKEEQNKAIELLKPKENADNKTENSL